MTHSPYQISRVFRNNIKYFYYIFYDLIIGFGVIGLLFDVLGTIKAHREYECRSSAVFYNVFDFGDGTMNCRDYLRDRLEQEEGVGRDKDLMMLGRLSNTHNTPHTHTHTHTHTYTYIHTHIVCFYIFFIYLFSYWFNFIFINLSIYHCFDFFFFFFFLFSKSCNAKVIILTVYRFP